LASTAESQGEESYRRIKHDIICCVLQPASEITEGELCDRYGLGKASVRTALARLNQEGLLKGLPRRGHMIAPITLGDVAAVFELRVILEPAAARLAAERADETTLRALVDLAQPLKMPVERGQGEFLRSNLRLNHQFHVGIAVASGNQRLTTSIAQLLEAVERVLHLWMSTQPSMDQQLAHEYGEHTEVAAALFAREGEKAAKLVEEHLVIAREGIFSSLMRNPQSLTLQVARS